MLSPILLRRLGLSVALITVACQSDPAPSEDASVTDVSTTDTATDAAPADVSRPDASQPDVSQPDAARADVISTDTPAADVASDRPTTDAAVDATMIDASRDASTDTQPSDVGCVESERFSCVSGTPGGTCGDALTPATCTADRWTCASGMIPISMCACAGRPPGSDCVCAAGGWRCGTDAGAVDAAPMCPTDMSTADGMPCTREGQSCGGPCSDSCSFCNIIVCRSGRWAHLEVFPDPRCMDSGRD